MTGERLPSQTSDAFRAPAAPVGSEVLLLETLPDHAEPLVFALDREGHAVTWVCAVEDALVALRAHRSPDLFIIDRGSPDVDGLEAIRQIRAEGYIGPIILVSGRPSEADLVHSLDTGADDYLAKPYGLAELTARIRAVLRRSPMRSDDSTPGRLIVDPASHRVLCDGLEISLSHKEFCLLAALASSEGTAVRRDQLVREIWGEWYGSPKTLNVTVGRVRQKLARAGVRDRITAIRGVGFRLDRAPSPDPPRP